MAHRTGSVGRTVIDEGPPPFAGGNFEAFLRSTGLGTPDGTESSAHSWEVPVGVTLIRVYARGGSGSTDTTIGDHLSRPGAGARLLCMIPVTPGEFLDIDVGGQGRPPLSSSSNPLNGAGGWPDGGNGGRFGLGSFHGGGGGGSTRLWRSATLLLIVGAGGGPRAFFGSGTLDDWATGAGDGGEPDPGLDAADYDYNSVGVGGHGATGSAGGAAGEGNVVDGNDGAAFAGADASTGQAGGGGGGRYGGGSGGSDSDGATFDVSGGGGGGSSETDGTVYDLRWGQDADDDSPGGMLAGSQATGAGRLVIEY